MAGIAVNRTVVAIVPEATMGTLLLPSSATQYTAIQADFSIDPGKSNLTSEELRDSIGEAKSIPGSEDPIVTLSHYFRASGTAGTAPDYNDIMKSAFGAEVVASTEYDTVSSSTTSIIKVDAGEGVNFQRGQALLIQDNVNGWRVRCVKSVATDDVTINFNLPNAPGTGVNLGKCVLWKPASTGHQPLSIVGYHGNSGAVEAVAGCLVTSLKISASAAQLPNMTATLAGLSHYFDPMEVTASNRYIDFTDDDGTWAAAIPLGWYKSPNALASAAQAAMRAVNSGETASVSYSKATGKFTITTTGTVLSLLFATGTNAANDAAVLLGFTATDKTGTAATTGYTSANAITLTSPQTPTLDTVDVAAAKNQEVMIGDATDYACFNTPIVDFTMDNTRAVQESLCAESGRSGAIVTKRMTTISVRQYLEAYDTDLYHRMQEGSTTAFQCTLGRKSGGQWVKGEVSVIYVPTATVENWRFTAQDGQAVVEATLRAFVGTDLLGEVYAANL
jgi:hypothetical protein